MPVEKGNKIKVEYEGRLENGEVFDSTEKHGQPLEFEVGSGQLIKGFDNAVLGMELNEEKEVTMTPEDSYGMPNPQLIQKVPKEHVPADVTVGATLAMGLPNGQQVPVTVTEVGETEVTMDMNHPLAGKTLVFKFKVVEIN